MEDSSKLLMKLEQAKTELEDCSAKVEMILLDRDIRVTNGEDPTIGDLFDHITTLAFLVDYLLNWRTHQVKRSIRVVREMIEEEEENDRRESS